MSQLEHLRALLAAIAPGNRFYTPRLAHAGVNSKIASLADFSERMPFTTKADLVADQAGHPPYGTNQSFPLPTYTRFCQTSGTTARALAILDTNESWQWMLGNWEVIYRAAGVTPGDRIYFAFSFGPFLGFWTAFEAAAKYGCLCIPGGGLTSSARLRAIIEHRAQVLCCTPTYALHLAELARRESIDLQTSAITRIIVAGEPGGSVPEVRERIAAAWRAARVIDHYGMTEVGPVAFEELDQPRVLRVIDDSYFAEVISPETGQAAADGQQGELVLTTLGRTAAPLLRYRTGDLVNVARDQRGWRFEGGIIGRSDDMVVVRGVNIYPSAIDAIVRAFPEITEYRVNVTRRGEMSELEVEAETDEAAVSARLEGALSAGFGLRIPVRRVALGILPRFEMKAHRWIRCD
jgi:phenylacetate-CoA ligase